MVYWLKNFLEPFITLYKSEKIVNGSLCVEMDISVVSKVLYCFHMVKLENKCNSGG